MHSSGKNKTFLVLYLFNFNEVFAENKEKNPDGFINFLKPTV